MGTVSNLEIGKQIQIGGLHDTNRTRAFSKAAARGEGWGEEVSLIFALILLWTVGISCSIYMKKIYHSPKLYYIYALTVCLVTTAFLIYHVFH